MGFGFEGSKGIEREARFRGTLNVGRMRCRREEKGTAARTNLRGLRFVNARADGF